MDDLTAWAGLGLAAAGLLAAAAPGWRGPAWALAGLLVWAWGRGFAGVDPGHMGLWITAAAAAAVVDHFAGTPAAKRLAVPGPARTAMVGGALLGAAALGPLGVAVGTVAGALAGLAACGYGVPAREGIRRAALGPWLGTMVQAGVAAAMAAWLGVQVFRNGG